MKIKKGQGIARLNLIPILDAIFIFIFFLLMSAEFVQLVEISINKSSFSNVLNKKEGLRLNIVLGEKDVLIETEKNGKKDQKKIKGLVGKNKYEAIYKIMIEIKRQNIEERKVTIIPSRNVKYEEIIRVMEVVRTIKKEDRHKLGLKESHLFDQFNFKD